MDALRPIIGQSFGWTPETDINMTIEREGEDISVKGKVGSPTLMVEKIVPIEGATEKQTKLREVWMKG